mmetsp:Transcript_8527/g.24573  ORF Transcript_8527/g.24573 Transcript_8527/m.24573 type:complete len:306 (+) Transcript_8527:341-1258(+)
MDADGAHQILERQSLPHGNAVSLEDLTSVGSDVMNSKHLVVIRFVHDDLGERVAGGSSVGQGPFQWKELAMVHLDVLLAQLLLGIVFRKSDARVFDWREHGCANVHVVHRLLTLSEQSAGQQNSSLDGHRREFRTSLHHVTACVDVWTGALLVVAHDLSVVGIHRDAELVQAQLCGVGRSSDGAQNGIVNIAGTVRERDLDAVSLHLFEFGWRHAALELHPMLLHVSADPVRAFSVEPAQQDAANGNRDILAEACQKSRALEADVGSSHAQRLAGVLVKEEDVVGRNGQLPALAVQRGWTATDSD